MQAPSCGGELLEDDLLPSQLPLVLAIVGKHPLMAFDRLKPTAFYLGYTSK